MKAKSGVFRSSFSLALAAVFVISACGGGGGGSNAPAANTTSTTSVAATTTPATATSTSASVFGTVDKISVAAAKPGKKAEAVKTAASALGGAAVTAIKSDGTSAGTTTTATDGTYTLLLPKNDTYVIKITSGNVVMKSVYTVGTADATVNVNPGTTAAVVILEKKLNTTFDSGTAFSTVVSGVDVNASVTAVAATAGFSTTATAVVAAVAANANPFTDTTVASAATTTAAATTITPVYTLMGGAVQKTLTLTGAVTTYAGSAGVTGSTDGTGTAARFNWPGDVTTDGTNLYVSDTSNFTIRKVVIATGAVTTIAGSAGVTGSSDGTGTAALFAGPRAITTDGTSLYVVERANSTIRKVVIATGVVTTIAGSAGITGSSDGTGTAARFNRPQGITTDGTSLYVVDQFNNAIRKVVIATGVVTTIAGGMWGTTDGTGTAARFNNPYGITTDGTSLYVAEVAAIRKVVIATGVVTTIAGHAGVTGFVDGTGTAAYFSSQIAGVTTDGANLYVSDTSNFTIRKVVIATGAVTTIAGSAGVTGSTDGTGTAAVFGVSAGLTTDGTSLYVVDTGGNTIRKIQ